MNEKFDLLGFIIDYESGALSAEEVMDGFQHLIDNGTVWSMQDHYVRAARALINYGLCKAAPG